MLKNWDRIRSTSSIRCTVTATRSVSCATPSSGSPPTGVRSTIERILPTMGRLRVIQSQRAGVDDIAPWLPPGVSLCNGAGVHDAATAELAIALILSALRGLPAFVVSQSQRSWAPNHDAQSLADKTVVIVGYGGIGRALGRRLTGFECEVVGVTRTGGRGTLSHRQLPHVLPTADVVVILTPLSSATHHLVDARFLSALKDDALLVNMSRGPVVDSQALLAETESGRIRAALDVTDPEPLPSDHPLWSVDSVIITPHAGGGTSAMGPRVKLLIEQQLGQLRGGSETPERRSIVPPTLAHM